MVLVDALHLAFLMGLFLFAVLAWRWSWEGRRREEFEVAFEVLNGPQRGERFPLTRFPALIGRGKRGPRKAVTLGDWPEHRRISRRHARVEERQGRFFLVDVGSKNGTWLNGQRLVPHRPYPLTNGDEVLLAEEIRLRFHGGPQR